MRVLDCHDLVLGGRGLLSFQATKTEIDQASDEEHNPRRCLRKCVGMDGKKEFHSHSHGENRDE